MLIVPPFRATSTYPPRLSSHLSVMGKRLHFLMAAIQEKPVEQNES